jgi:hypothetical protein
MAPKGPKGPNYKDWYERGNESLPYPPIKPIRLPNPGRPWHDYDYYKRIWEWGNNDDEANREQTKRENMERIRELIEKAREKEGFGKKKPDKKKKPKKPKKRKPPKPKKEPRVPEGTRDLDIDF